MQEATIHLVGRVIQDRDEHCVPGAIAEANRNRAVGAIDRDPRGVVATVTAIVLVAAAIEGSLPGERARS
jgi:hypothetical protein